MGRERKYKTEEERLKARRDRQMRYYWRNDSKIKKNNLERYHADKEMS